ncbi:MAG TPA: hypothetical protein VM888_07595 [Chitinophagaceae bacterium]|nr:hypothetical protein [Chitinophagaceae bacterium]
MKTKFLSLFAAALAIGFTACNNESESSSTTDSSSTGTAATTDGTTNATTSTATSNQDYTALADTFRINSEAGNYLDPKTGKSIKIAVDPATGTRYNTATNEPVWRYVDRRTWWVYGGDNWDTLGTAKMQNNNITYRNDDDTWVTYDQRWKTDDDRMKSDYKKKYGDTKIKVSKDGDIKIKDESGKVKYDADDNKVKTDSSK